MKLFFILFLAASLRLWNLSDRLPFLADQGRDMLVVYRMVQNQRPTLLGPPSSQGNFFFGPLYYYLVAPGLILMKFNPLGASLMVIFIDLIGLYFLFRLTQSLPVALIYATHPLLIHWSQSALNPFFIPGLTAACLFCLSRRRWFVSGILAGSIIQLHYAALPLLIVLFWLSRRHLLSSFIGLLAGLSPLLAFELRHQFFNTHAIIKFLAQSSVGNFNLHYLAVFVPFLFWGLSFLFHRFRFIAIPATIFILAFNLSQIDLSPAQGYTMPAYWNLRAIYRTAEIIAADVVKSYPTPFNVAATLDGDSRALPLRFLLEAQFRTIPLGVEQYPQTQVLYLVARWEKAETLKHGLWEISSFAPKKVTQTWPITADIKLYKLIK